jgi:cytidine deaminase
VDSEDQKLVTLARAALQRALVSTWYPAGAAVRDETGRTYAAATVEMDGATVTALQLAVASAVSSGARTFEAAAIVTDDPEPDVDGITALNAFGDVPTIIQARADGTVAG